MREANRGDVKRALVRKAIRGSAVAVILVLLPPNALAQGGPPLITDDPDTPGPGYWEINLASIVEKARPDRRLEAPLADINYGLGPRIQLKFEIPWLNVRETGKPVQAGLGNSIVGVKWRFLGEEGQRIAWAIYPQVQVNTGRVMAEKGFVNDGSQFLLPTELTIQKSRLEVNAEVGRNFVQKGDDGWIFGLATEVEFDRGFELVGELTGEQSGSSTAELIVNVGARKLISRQIVLLTAAGRGVRGPADERLQLRLYVGLQLNLPHQYPLSQSTHK
jgi:Putative MetA-pathway of phenol degradation